MTTGNTQDDDARAITQARHDVYNRLAFISAAIWAVGTLVLFVRLVPPTITKPVPEIVVSMMLPLIPAALPWLFYPALSRAVARRYRA